MQFNNAELALIKLLIEDKLDEIYDGPEGLQTYWKIDILQKLLKDIAKINDNI